MFKVWTRVLLAVVFFSVFQEGFAQRAFDYPSPHYEGGLHFGYIWFNNLKNKPDGSLGAAYWYGDAGLIHHITKPWTWGFKLAYGSELGNFSFPAASEFTATLETKYAFPMGKPDDAGVYRFLYVGFEGGWAFNSANYYSGLPGISSAFGTFPQNESWQSPVFRISVSAYYVEAAYQMMLPVNAGDPTGSVVSLGARLMLY